MSNAYIDLMALRCPNAQVQLNSLLKMFLDSSACFAMDLVSIEPSLERSLRERIAHYDLPLLLDKEVQEVAITGLDIEKWKDNFDAEDYEDVKIKRIYTIRKYDSKKS